MNGCAPTQRVRAAKRQHWRPPPHNESTSRTPPHPSALTARPPPLRAQNNGGRRTSKPLEEGRTGEYYGQGCADHGLETRREGAGGLAPHCPSPRSGSGRAPLDVARNVHVQVNTRVCPTLWPVDDPSEETCSLGPGMPPPARLGRARRRGSVLTGSRRRASRRGLRKKHRALNACACPRPCG